MSKLEQEKEHWMLEHQLLKIKYENELEVSALGWTGTTSTLDNMDYCLENTVKVYDLFI